MMEVHLPIAYITDRSRKCAQVRGASSEPSPVFRGSLSQVPSASCDNHFSDRARNVRLLDRRHFR